MNVFVCINSSDSHKQPYLFINNYFPFIWTKNQRLYTQRQLLIIHKHIYFSRIYYIMCIKFDHFTVRDDCRKLFPCKWIETTLVSRFKVKFNTQPFVCDLWFRVMPIQPTTITIHMECFRLWHVTLWDCQFWLS